MSSEQPVEQKPHTERVVAAGFIRAGTCPNPKSAGCSTKSSVSGPVHWRRKELEGESGEGRAIFIGSRGNSSGHAFGCAGSEQNVTGNRFRTEGCQRRQDGPPRQPTPSPSEGGEQAHGVGHRVNGKQAEQGRGHEQPSLRRRCPRQQL